MKIQYFALLGILFFTSCEKNTKIQAEGEFRFNSMIKVGKLERTYTVVLPSTYYQSQANFPVVIAMHGGGGSAQQMEDSYGLKEKSETEKYIAVYPDGVESDGFFKARTWNAGLCCDYAAENNIDDVGFLSVMIDELNIKFKTNAKRVYLTGMSNGGMMAYKLACEIPSKIAAIAPVACTMVTVLCKPSLSVPIIQFHSELDKNVPYNGGIGIRGVNYPAVEKGLSSWSTINDCMSLAKIVKNNDNYTQKAWTSCNAQTEIQYYLTKDGGHSWPGATLVRAVADVPSKAINANELIFDFFAKHSR